MLKLVAGALVLALIGWGAITFFGNQDNLGVFRSSSGFIDRGGRFGVRVGDDVGTVDRSLRRHDFHPYAREDLQTCLTHDYPRTEGVVVYVDDTWRKGTACIAYDRLSRRVRSIEWAYYAFTVEL